MTGIEMKDPKVIAISIKDTYIAIDLDMRDVEIINIFLNGLTEYVDGGSQLKIIQTYTGSHTDSRKMISKLISKRSQMIEWRNDLKQLLCVMQQEICV